MKRLTRALCFLLCVGLLVLIVVLFSRRDTLPREETLSVQPEVSASALPLPVLIGGAGVSGIEIASKLHEKSIDFIIIEASELLGGRVRTKTFGGYTLEAGANWIQGTIGNPVNDLKTTYGLEGVKNNFDDVILYDENGVLIPDIYKTPVGLMADEAFVGAGTFSRRCLREETPIGNQGTLKFCRDIQSSFIDGRKGDDLSIAQAQKLFNGFEAGTNVERVLEYYSVDFELAQSSAVTSVNNTLPLNTYNDYKDENYMALNDPLGYARIFIKHAASFLTTSENTDTKVTFNDPRLKLQTRILSVDRRSDSYVDVTVCKTRKVRVNEDARHECISGTTSVIRGSHFVSTFSVGVMAESVREENANVPFAQRTAPRFIPSLPLATKVAFTEYPMALYSKIFFRFDWKFWQDEEMMLSAFRDGEFAPVWQSLDMPGFLPGSKILFLTVTGERARELQLLPNTPASDTIIINQLLPVLNQIFPTSIRSKTGGRLLRRSDVKEFSMTRWLQDDLHRGMYSNWKVNRTWEQQQPMRDQIGRLWLSGEATCFRQNGYTHGALNAGRRTAAMLLHRSFGGETPPNSICDLPPNLL
jgi:polyamine oxidase